MKKTILSIILCIFIIVFCISLFFINSNDSLKVNEGNSVIEIKHLKTSNGFNESIDNDKFKLTSKEELESFKELYTGFDLEEIDYEKYNVFIETKVSGSGSNEIILEKVNITDKISFDIKITSSEVGTMDMAYWYLIAIIPKEKLNNVNIDDWKSPEDFK